jgi:hypothetical protein
MNSDIAIGELSSATRIAHYRKTATTLNNSNIPLANTTNRQSAITTMLNILSSLNTSSQNVTRGQNLIRQNNNGAADSSFNSKQNNGHATLYQTYNNRKLHTALAGGVPPT